MSITEDNVEDMADFYNVDLPVPIFRMVEILRELHAENVERFKKGIVSFDDLIYFPANYDKCPKY